MVEETQLCSCYLLASDRSYLHQICLSLILYCEMRKKYRPRSSLMPLCKFKGIPDIQYAEVIPYHLTPDVGHISSQQIR